MLLPLKREKKRKQEEEVENYCHLLAEGRTKEAQPMREERMEGWRDDRRGVQGGEDRIKEGV